MQSNNINVLMISYGRGTLYENKAGVLDRHIEYASHFDSLDIIYLTKKKFDNTNYGKLNIIPIYGISYLICLLKAIFRDVKTYQVVTTQDPFITGILGLFYKKRFGLKLHIQNHSNFIDNKYWIKENRLIHSILNFIAKKLIIPNADRLRVVNSFEKQIYIDKLKIPKSKIDIAPIAVNPIFSSKVSKSEITIFLQQYGIEKNKFIIGWAGRFVRLKRIDYLFELVSSIKKKIDFQLVLAGDYKNSEFDLKYLENKYSIKPILLGHLAPNELVKFYHAIDTFVLTSEYEGYGMVVSEAISSGTPVLISNKSKGPKDIIIEGSNGYFFSDKVDFKSKINLLSKKNFFVNKKDTKVINAIQSIKKSL